MIDKLESDITNNWTGRIPAVSVVCFSYNFEKYISQALDGILSQETDFPFEVIVHDDASTDGSRTILEEYKKKYPKIITLIQQNENQFSQGKRIILLATKYAKGAYVMYCDGDDYWHNTSKINLQYKKMKNYPDLNISFHPVEQCKEGGKGMESVRGYKGKKDVVFSQSSVVKGGGSFMMTPSIMIKKQSIDAIPAWFHNVGVGDYFFQVLLSSRDALYFSDVLSTYRVSSSNSFTLRNKSCKERLHTTRKNLYGLSRLFFHLNGVRIKIDILIRSIKIIVRLFYCLRR
jgi:glycosyltransferase involved in cell wall biosynthesis